MEHDIELLMGDPVGTLALLPIVLGKCLGNLARDVLADALGESVIATEDVIQRWLWKAGSIFVVAFVVRIIEKCSGA
jgi:hypothetical protein